MTTPPPAGSPRERCPGRLPQPSPQRRASDARTLYLAAPQRLRVTSTGEALVVSRPEAPQLGAQRVPVARVLRIVSTDAAEWSGAALALCLQRGITITWLDRQGEAIGHLWPARRQAVDLADALEALSGDEPGWSDAYHHWLRHERLVVLRHWRAERAAAGHPVDGPEWQQAKQRWVYQDQLTEHLPPLLHGMAAALVTHRLSECGLQPHYWCCAGEPIALGHDLTRLVWAEMNHCAGALAAAIDHPQEAAALFERWSGHCVGALHAHLAQLRAHALRELQG